MIGIYFFLAIPVLVLWRLWRWQRRNRLLHEFVAKHGLSTEQSSTAVDPGIKGLVFDATYPLWLEGVFEGVSVVAFDYALGGKNRPRGSGVGVRRRRAVAVEHLGAGLQTAVHGEWTFVYGRRALLWDSRMDPARMESLWLRLLHAPGPDGDSEQVVPAFLHIAPRTRSTIRLS